MSDDCSATEVNVERVDSNGRSHVRDILAVEEPLEIRLHFEADGRLVRKTVSITMRTPGDDANLAAGFLFTEGIVHDAGQIESIEACGPFVGDGTARNVVRVSLHSAVSVDLARLERHFYTTSSCGVCGKTSIEALHATPSHALPSFNPILDASVVHALPAALRAAQSLFDRTGGLHASALFDMNGTLLSLREDVGRHNALDKVIGGEFVAGRLPLHDRIVLVSGRASFELVQKAMMAGIPVLAAVCAPSSLAVQLAESA
ncbi:MAG: formate dehydrogenase accessory sulfurtransferase FdhD, partial [Gemmatimonas sp.]